MQLPRKKVAWIGSEIKTPPISQEARKEIGRLIRRLQRGLNVTMPHSRPMPDIGSRCHELRVNDAHHTWRIIYRIDDDAIVIVHAFNKKTQTTPEQILRTSKKRLTNYDAIIGENPHG